MTTWRVRKVMLFGGLLLLATVGVVFGVRKLTDTASDAEREAKVEQFNDAVRKWEDAKQPYQNIEQLTITGLPDDFGNITLTARREGDLITDKNSDLLHYDQLYFEYSGNLPFHTSNGDYSPWAVLNTGIVLTMNGTTSGTPHVPITKEKSYYDSNWKECVNYNDGSLFSSLGICKVYLRSTHFCFMVGRDAESPMSMSDDGCFGPSRGFVEKMATLSVGHEDSVPTSIQLTNSKVRVRINGDPFIAALLATHDTLDFGTTATERETLGFIILFTSIAVILVVIVTFLCGLKGKGWCVKHPNFPEFHHQKAPSESLEKDHPAALEPVGRSFSTIPDTEMDECK
eukprot:TRINITY_DN10307_c3_g2_i1.p1 TRINITY_DN10307_c3_g2~~TRINITY_DN10307_c3_g2_i1.p1  ORF type:complete len:366 (+),score=63.06 TRINITY_DN10307_c3_g2_i1:70-1098(+)